MYPEPFDTVFPNAFPSSLNNNSLEVDSFDTHSTLLSPWPTTSLVEESNVTWTTNAGFSTGHGGTLDEMFATNFMDT